MLVIIVSAVTTIAASVISTCVTYRYTTRKYRHARRSAMAALNVFCKYKRYGEAVSEFNAAFSKAEKSVIIICLYHLGIPIALPLNGQLDLHSVVFDDVDVDQSEINKMRKLVAEGLCDEMFYKDYKTFFAADIKISRLRELAVRYVNEVLPYSTYCNGESIIPQERRNLFSAGEKRALYSFSKVIEAPEYYRHDGFFAAHQKDAINREIESGLWDAYLLTPAEAYINMDTQYSVMRHIINRMATGFQPVTMPQSGNMSGIHTDKENGVGRSSTN